jgi:hypothetical protein
LDRGGGLPSYGADRPWMLEARSRRNAAYGQIRYS